jgi:hypothetical protein
MPDKTVPYNVFTLRIAEMYYRAALEDGTSNAAISQQPDIENKRYTTAIQTGNQIVKRLADIYEDDLRYYFSLKGKYSKLVDRDKQQGMAIMNELLRLAREARQEQLAKELEARFNKLQEAYLKAQ